jgi:hypothetical protein
VGVSYLELLGVDETMLRKVMQRAVAARASQLRALSTIRAKSTFAVADEREPFNPFEVQPGCLQPGTGD